MDFMPQIIGCGLLTIAGAVFLISLRLMAIEKKLDQLIGVLKDSQGKHEPGTQGQ
jgi:hypothetical protein